MCRVVCLLCSLCSEGWKVWRRTQWELAAPVPAVQLQCTQRPLGGSASPSLGLPRAAKLTLAALADRGAWWAAVHGVAQSRTRLSDFTFTFHFHALQKEMGSHSSVLAWRIPGTGEPGGLPSMGSHRVGHDCSDLAAAASAVWKAAPLWVELEQCR